MDTNIVPVRLASPVASKMDELERMASYNLAGVDLTGPERIAALAFEKLRLAQENRFASDILAGIVMAEIEANNLWSVHPERYNSAEEGYEIIGLSKSEVSDMRRMVGTIFPFLAKMEKEHGMDFDATETVTAVGKSNMRTITPHLCVVITGEPSKQDNVNEFANRIVTMVEEQFKKMNIRAPYEKIQMHAVKNILEIGRGRSMDLKKEIKKEEQHEIKGFTCGNGKVRYAVLELATEDDFGIFSHLEAKYFNLGYLDPGASLTDVPMFRKMLEVVSNAK